MECPHCGIRFHAQWQEGVMGGTAQSLAGLGQLMPAFNYGPDFVWLHRATLCPECKQLVLEIFAQNLKTGKTSDSIRAYPDKAAHKPLDESVPIDVRKDYLEACEVLSISPRASAALARRCLQRMLRSNGYRSHDLAKEIDMLLNESDPQKVLSFRTRQSVDAIRNFGNFAAHPIESRVSLEIVEVEPHEAEWCLETIRELFDHFYIAPSIVRRRRADLNAKLASAGKPPAKG